MIKLKDENQGWFELKADMKGREKKVYLIGKYKTLHDAMDAYADYRDSLIDGVKLTSKTLHLEYWEFNKAPLLINKLF